MGLTLDAIDYRKLEWDDEEKIYRYPSGRKVSDRGIMAIISSQQSSMQSNQGWSLNQLKEGKMSFEEFQQFNAKMIRDYHTIMMRLGKGGKTNTSPNDYLEVARELRLVQYPRFEQFMIGIQEGNYSEKYIANRLSLYADSIKVSYERGRLSHHNHREGRRQLGGCLRHCQSCIYYASLGWMPVPDIVPPGVACECGPNCCCFVELRDLSDKLPLVS